MGGTKYSHHFELVQPLLGAPHTFQPQAHARGWIDAKHEAPEGRQKAIASQGLSPLPGLDIMQYPIRGLAPPDTRFGPGAWSDAQFAGFRDRN
jgi:hypothetical protein